MKKLETESSHLNYFKSTALMYFQLYLKKSFQLSNYSGQSQRMQSNPLFNQNSKQLREAREKLREQVTIGFGFTSDWLRKWHELFNPESLSVVMQNQSEC